MQNKEDQLHPATCATRTDSSRVPQDRMQGLGFKVWGLGFEGLGFRVQGLAERPTCLRYLGALGKQCVFNPCLGASPAQATTVQAGTGQAAFT